MTFSTIFSALRYLGLGAKRVIAVPIDDQGRMRAAEAQAAIARCQGPTIVVAQSGHINSGAFDPFSALADACQEKNAWLHIDGAIGLWAAAVPSLADRVAGLARADSWAADGHKWLQTPHDCGYAIVKNSAAHRRAMAIHASYLPASDLRIPADLAPELSRRARGFATWAMLRTLGRDGLVTMVERHCALAKRMASRLAREPGLSVLNEIALTQIAVALGDDLPLAQADALTARTIERIQRDGVCFVGGAHWRGRQIVRVSVIGAQTTEGDVDASVDAIVAAYRAERGA